MLLIATNRDELAADYLILRLRDRGISFCRFNTETLGEATELEITCGRRGTDFRLNLENGDEVEMRSIRGVYFHHAKAPYGNLCTVENQGDFAADELLETLKSLWRLIPEEKWLNHPAHLWRAENKIDQLAMAHRIGLAVPDTLITCRSSSIRHFLQKHCGDVVVKAVRHGFVIGDEGMQLAGTQRIDSSFPDRMHQYAGVPAIYQEAISRRSDVRVVVVDTTVFAVEIMGASDHVDWRIAEITGQSLDYQLIRLPLKIEQSCMTIVREFGLRYSSIDLIRSKDNGFVFLELNPSGQWAWLEQITGCPIRDSIIDAFDTADA